MFSGYFEVTELISGISFAFRMFLKGQIWEIKKPRVEIFVQFMKTSVKVFALNK